MTRTIGVEIEFSNLSIDQTAEILIDQFGGDVKKHHSSLVELTGTNIGDIKIELDAHLAKTLSKNTKKYQSEPVIGTVMSTVDLIGNEVMQLSAVPIEIVFPPVSEKKLQELDILILKLEDAGAKGSYEKIIYAFGVHLNVEIEEETVDYFRDILLSFFLLQAWLAQKSRVDFSRIISGYNKLYPHSFGKGIIEKRFKTLKELILFYKEKIIDRNYALDMYPVWGYLQKPLISDLKDSHLNSVRPTFHYRLPDCKIGEEGWSFTQELKLWQEVETLARNKEKLEKISHSYIKDIKDYTDPLDKKWLNILSTEWGYHA